MTRAATFRQRDVDRAIRAAQKAGLCITGIRADGTLIVTDPERQPLEPVDQEPMTPESALNEWLKSNAKG